MDTGVGSGNGAIDEWYHPQTISLATALGTAGLAPSDIASVVLSHLHFDHCGQQGALSAPTYVQAVEFDSARTWLHSAPTGRKSRRTGFDSSMETRRSPTGFDYFRRRATRQAINRW